MKSSVRATLQNFHLAWTRKHIQSSETAHRLQDDHVVYNGQPMQLYGPPVRIYHPVFVTFIRESSDTTTEVTPMTLEMARELILVSLQFYETVQDLRVALERLDFWSSILPTEHNLDKTAVYPDGTFNARVHPSKGHWMVVQIVDVENEIGKGECDPISEAEGIFTSIVRSAGVCVHFLSHIRVLLSKNLQYRSTCKVSCCPTILVGIADPHLVVAGAVNDDVVTVQRLTDYVHLCPRPNREGRPGLCRRRNPSNGTHYSRSRDLRQVAR